MMKIAVEIKNEKSEELKKQLNRKKYKVFEYGINKIWIYNLGNIRFGGDCIYLEDGKSIISGVIKFEDIEYFEIHNQEEVK